jgi:ubiquinone/menaquinone biosynthesis C-methylase UbiE
MIAGRPNLFIRLRAILMQCFFSLLYNQMAWSYDLVADMVSVGMWKDWVRAVMPFITGPRVLEFGHGPGHLQVALHQKAKFETDYHQIIGVDKSKQMGKIAYRRLKRLAYQPTLVNCDAMRLPLPDGSVHQVVTTFPSEYISNPETLDEVQRVLTSGGNLLILALAWITGKSLHQRAAARLFEITGQSPTWDDRYLDPVKKKGFLAQVERVSLPNSQILIIIITKP